MGQFGPTSFVAAATAFSQVSVIRTGACEPLASTLVQIELFVSQVTSTAARSGDVEGVTDCDGAGDDDGPIGEGARVMTGLEDEDGIGWGDAQPTSQIVRAPNTAPVNPARPSRMLTERFFTVLRRNTRPGCSAR